MNYTKDELIVLPITLLIIISISLILYLLLRKKNDKIKNIPLACIAILVVALEITKQYLSLKSGTYSFWSLPLHFCSLFLFFFPLATLIPSKKIKTFASTMSLVCSLWMTVLFYIDPRTIIASASSDIFGSFHNFHTFTYHHLVILYLFLGILLNQFIISKRFYLHVFIGITSYALVAIPLAHLFQINFCNILYSNIPLMESLRVNYGQVIYTIVLYLAGLMGGLITCLVYRKIKSIKGGEKR